MRPPLIRGNLFSRNLPLLLAGLFLAANGLTAQAGNILKSDTTTMSSASDWGGIAPTVASVGEFGNTPTSAHMATMTLGGAVALGGLQFDNNTLGALTVANTGGYALTLDASGLNLASANNNATFNCGLALSAPQTWTVASGRTLAIGGTSLNAGANALTITGAGNETIAGATVITSTGGITKNGAGQLVITGAATTADSVTTLTANGGQLGLSSGGGANVLNSSANLVVGGGAVYYQYNSAVNSALNNLTINPGESAVYMSRNGSFDQGLTISGTVTRNLGGTVYSKLLDTSRGYTIYSSMTSLTLVKDANGTAYMTTGNALSSASTDDFNDWAAINSGHQVVAASYTSTTASSLGTAAQNANVNVAKTTLAANATDASFRDNDNIAATVDLAGFTLQTGGILVTSAKATAGSIIEDSVGTGAIVGPSTAANSDIVILVDTKVATPVPYTISAAVANNTGGFSTAITKGAPGTLILSGNNTFTGGVYINNGILQLGSAGALNATTPNAINFDGSGIIAGVQYTNYGNVATAPTLALAGNNATVASISSANDLAGTSPLIENADGSAVANATLTVSPSGTPVFTGAIQDGTGGGKLGLAVGGTGTLTVGGTLSYSGATTVNSGGTLALANIPSATAGYVVNGGLNVGVSGGGTLALGAQYLSGGGTVNGSVTTAAGTILAPGAGTSTLGGIGALTVNNNLTLSAGSVVNFGLDPTQVNNSQVIDNAGTFTLPAAGKVSLNLYSPGTSTPFAAAGTYNLFAYPTGSGVNVSSLSSEFTIATPITGFVPAFSTTVVGGTTYVTLTLTVSVSVVATWTDGDTATDDNWSDAGNWTGGVPSLAGSTATFGNVVSPVVLDAAESVGTLNFNQANSYTITGSSPLTLDNSGVGATVSVMAGTANQIQTPVDLNDGTTITVSSGTSLTLSGVVANTATPETLSVGGGGTLALITANTYGPASGSAPGTSLSGGTLQVGNNGSLGAGYLNVVGNSTLQAAPATTLTVNNPIAITTGLTTTVNNNGNSLTLGGIISGGGSVTATGSGTLVLNGANSYGGSTTLNAGTVSISSDGNLGAAPGSATPNSIIINGGDLLGNGTVTLNANRGVGIGATSGSANATAFVDAAGGGTFTINGVIASAGNSGADGLTVNNSGGSGTVVLGGANTFNGTTVIGAGNLQLANSLALQNSSVTYNTGTLQFGSGITAATLAGFTGSQSLSLNNQANAGVTLTVGANNASWNYAGVFSGLGSLVKAGSGTLTLSAANSFSGSLTVNGGSVVLPVGGVFNGSSVYPSSGNLTVSGGTLTASAGSTIGTGSTVQTLSVTGGTATFAGGIGMPNEDEVISVTGGTFSSSSITLNRGAASFTTAPTATVPVAATVGDGFYVNNAGTIANVGTLTIGSTLANSSANARVDGGTVTVTNEILLGNTSNTRYSILQINGGAFTSLDTVNGIVISANDGTTSANLSELYLSGGTTTANLIGFGNSADTLANTGWLIQAGGSLYVGAGGIVKHHAADTVNIILTNGILGAAANWTSSIPMQLSGVASSAITIQTADAAGHAWNIGLGGALTGSGALTASGGGTLTLGGANTYTGATTVSNGTLLVTGSLGASTVTVLSGAALGGSGTLNGPVTYNTGADAVFTEGSPATFAGILTLDQTGSGTVVKLNLPGSLGAGTYTLASYPASGSAGAVNPTPVILSGGVTPEPPPQCRRPPGPSAWPFPRRPRSFPARCPPPPSLTASR